MIRRLVKGALRRLVADTPHIPSAPSSGRARPTRGQTPRPSTGPDASAEAQEDPEDEADEDDGSEVELHVEELASWAESGRSYVVLDIREPHELWSGAPEGGLLIPMNQVPQRLAELPRDREVVVVCAAGVRSFGVAHYLREQGLERAWSLVEGFGGYVGQGFAYHQPPSGSALRLTHQVALPEALVETLPAAVVRATIQRLDTREDGEIMATLLVSTEQGTQMLTEVPASSLRRT